MVDCQCLIDDINEFADELSKRRFKRARLRAKMRSLKRQTGGERIKGTADQKEDLRAALAKLRTAARHFVDDEPDDGDRDWKTFFESLAAFLEKIIPLIVKILSMFLVVA